MNVEILKNEFSLWSDSEYSIALSNGTVALDLALIALDLKKEDEVIVTPRSFYSFSLLCS